MLTRLHSALFSFLFLAAAANAGQGSAQQVSVTLDTRLLIGSAYGPFTLAFQLADGSLTGDGNNAVVVSNIRIDGAIADSPCTYSVSPPGNLASSINLTDLPIFGICRAPFVPGNTLSFDVFFSNSVEYGVPDEFVMAILAGNNQALPTAGGVAFFQIDFDSAHPTVQTFAGYGIAFPAPTVSGLTTLSPPSLTSPSNGMTGVPVTPTLTWSASAGATSYDVYFGASSPPDFQLNSNALNYSPPALAYDTIYYWQVVAKNGASVGASPIWSFTTQAEPSASGLQFVPVTPCRLADTRYAPGEFGGPSLGAASIRDFAIPSSACGIPGDALAYSLNVTAVPQGPLGYLSVWPAGQAQPLVSTLNSDGRVKANAAIVPAGLDGAISVYASNPTDVVLDIDGYFIAPGAGTLAFYPLTPCRIADTRLPNAALGGPSMTPNVARSFPILSSACGIPPTAQAYALNMTVVPSGALNFLATWPAGSPQPLVSTLNATTGTVLANAAIVPAGTGGAIDVLATDPTDVVIDINGYFATPGQPGALSLYPVTPCRVADTRNPPGPFGGPPLIASASRSFPVPSSSCGIPAGAKAYSLNATVVPPSVLWFLTLFGNAPLPYVSTLNDPDASVVANAALVPAAGDGSVSAYASSATDLILDINGYFAP